MALETTTRADPERQDVPDDTFNLHTLWPLTRNSLPVIITQVLFAWANVGDGVVEGGPTLTKVKTVERTIFAIGWLWLHLLVENVSYQRLEASKAERSRKKPWRPLSACRLSPVAARRLLFIAVFSAITMSCALNVVIPSLSIMTLIWLFNGLYEADDNFVLRDALHTGSMLSFGYGATLIVNGSSAHLTRTGYRWFGILAAVIITTAPVRDLADVNGDETRDLADVDGEETRALADVDGDQSRDLADVDRDETRDLANVHRDETRNRRTLPQILGERNARALAAVLAMFWTVLCAAYWCPNLLANAIFLAGILVLAIAICSGKGQILWLYWCVWMMQLFTFPLLTKAL